MKKVLPWTVAALLLLALAFTLPRFRYDRLMAFGWKVLLLLALANLFIASVLLVMVGG